MDMWLQRKAINNSTFRNEYEIGKAEYLIGHVTTITLMAL